MSDDQPAPPPDRREVKAEAAAEKARAKAQRPWWKKKRFIGPLALIALIVIAVVSDGGGEPSPTADRDTAEEADENLPEEAPAEVPEEAEFARVGEPAADGQFTFVVRGLECGHATVGEDPFVDEAQGQFCLLTVEVENTGAEARSLSASSQYLYDDQERRFDAHVGMGSMDTPIFEQINPGNRIEGVIVFDVPVGVVIEFAELHDSAFSGGVLVALR